MKCRRYGSGTPTVVIAHGGPGAAGEIAPVAQELAEHGHAVLEPFQTKKTVEGQITELRQAIYRNCAAPVSIVGWSWGAWLVCLLAARHPDIVESLVLVGSGPFEASWAEDIKSTRLSRLNDHERSEYQSLAQAFDEPANATRIMELFDKMDGYATDDTPHPTLHIDMSIHAPVWKEASDMRASGELLERISEIRCPVLALHGDYDPHPAIGVEQPLRERIASFDFKLLDKCGHKPWREIHAKDAFFKALENAVRPLHN